MSTQRDNNNNIPIQKDCKQGFCNGKQIDNKQSIPYSDRYSLTLAEAVEWTGIGRIKLEELMKAPDCDFVIWIGPKKRVIRRKALEDYLDSHNRLDDIY